MDELELKETEASKLELTEITAGIPVVDFLKNINGNFNKIAGEINGLEEHSNITRKITIDTTDPKGGNSGDIWIVYEQK